MQQETVQKEIARTILGQIMASDKMALHAWGAEKFVALNEAHIKEGYQIGGVQFEVNGAKKQGRVVVRLMGNDTYRVEAVDEIRPCVYCDELESEIDSIIER